MYSLLFSKSTYWRRKNLDDETLEYNYYSSNKGPSQINPTYDTDENGNIILDSIRGDKIPKPPGVQMKIIMNVMKQRQIKK